MTSHHSAADRIPGGEFQAHRGNLAQVLSIVDHGAMPGKTHQAAPTAGHSTLVRVRGIIKARRQRDRLFADGLFADPAWDLLLELYAAELCGYRLSVTALCLAVTTPATTAIRWIGCLEEKGLARRTPDQHDGRRAFISLSGAGLEAMGQLMREVSPPVSLM